MSTLLKIEAADREFCEVVAQAAFINPFSPERLALDEKIIGTPEPVDSAERVERLTRAVAERVRKLDAAGRADVRRYVSADRQVMQTVLLFEVYHWFFNLLDQLILEQVERGDTPCSVGFADKALDTLARRGFARPEALRYFAMFYQLRRAFHFIERGLLGRSSSMQELRRRLWNNVFTCDTRWYDRHFWNRMEDFSTLLLGETGTGKGTAAAAIGRSGFIPFDERKGCFTESFTRSFTALNLSQHPETLIESELFGHRKGAFTGAVEAHQGVFGRCSPHGAIFLDEIGDVSVPVQIKLLQVLQERTFSPVGSHEKIRFHGRTIAATNQPLTTLRERKLFRNDFYYRLCSDVITVPPLRQRLAEEPRELDELLEHVVARLVGNRALELVAMVRRVIRRDLDAEYPWPGNVRELEQAVRRILLTQHYKGDEHAATPSRRDALVRGMEAGTLDADALLSGYCGWLYDRFGSYEEVARRTRLDRRTVKKYVLQQSGTPGAEES